MKHLTNAFQGQNQWWRYFVLFIASLIGGQFIGAIPLIIVITIKAATSGGAMLPNPENAADLTVFGIGQNFGLFLMLLPFVASLFILIRVFKPLHHRDYKTLISGVQKIRWSRFFISAAIWTIILGAYLFFDYIVNPENFKLNFDLFPFIVLCLISICLIPFQASYEEFLFRGYIAQGFGIMTRSRIHAILVPSLLFGLMHSLNPEIEAYGFWLVMPQYIIFGFIFGVLTILDDGIELGMGAHSANNVFASIFVTSNSSVLQTPALLIQKTLDPVKELIALAIAGIVFVVILSFIFKWKFGILTKKIEP